MRALTQNPREALAPADVGYYLDVLEGRLEQSAGVGIARYRQGDRRRIELKLRARFESGSAGIEARLGALLKRLAAVLIEYRKTLIGVRMCVGGSGSEGVDPKLAGQRAMAVAHRLIDAGVAVNRIVVIPLEAQATHADDADCRRADLWLEPIVRAANGRR